MRELRRRDAQRELAPGGRTRSLPGGLQPPVPGIDRDLLGTLLVVPPAEDAAPAERRELVRTLHPACAHPRLPQGRQFGAGAPSVHRDQEEVQPGEESMTAVTKLTSKPERITRTTVDTIMFTQAQLEKLKSPPFQRPLNINHKV